MTSTPPRPPAFTGHLFDLDGVITPTAEVHMRAWEEMFSAEFARRRVSTPYTDADYFEHLDGRPRYDGVRAVLASRQLELPEGTPADPPDADTVCALGNRKNELLNALLREEGITPYPGTLAYLDALSADARLAIVSSSRNAAEVLRGAGLRDRFEVIVDGTVAAELGLPGKPAPDTFWHAARELGVDPADAVVYEDAVSGVEAGAAGSFGAVVGVDRGAGRDALAAAGATVVVTDLQELA